MPFSYQEESAMTKKPEDPGSNTELPPISNPVNEQPEDHSKAKRTGFVDRTASDSGKGFTVIGAKIPSDSGKN